MDKDYPFFKKYLIDPMKVEGTRRIGRMKHLFFPIPEEDLEEALKKYNPFPEELENFYRKIGFGFMYRRQGKISCLLDPVSLVNTNCLLGYYAEDSAITEALGYINTEEQLLFFKADGTNYFSINRTTNQKGNSIWYKGHKVADTLHYFLEYYYINDMYIPYLYDKVEKIISYNKHHFVLYDE